jgi:hypothetical protein
MQCCQQQCVSTACPSGRTFSSDTCQCECTPVTCPDGQTQDPLTCQCVDKCANVTCGTCQECDTQSGQCVNASNNSDCGGGNVCCDGACKSDCTCNGLACSNGDCCPNSDEWGCCEDGCCPKVAFDNGGYGDYCLAPGSGPGFGDPNTTIGGCCQPDKLMKLSTIDAVTQECMCDVPDDGYDVYCEGNMPATYYYQAACSCGHWFS